MVRENENGFGDWGGYMDAKITKLEEQFAKSSDPFRQSNLFNGISIYVNGLTDPSADELKRIMMVHGGVYHHYQRSHTTFIIASNLPDVKVRNMNTSRIISPQWVVDCLKESRILDYTKYLLYTNHKPSQPKLFFQKKSDATVKPEEDKPGEGSEVADIIRELSILNERMKASTSSSDINKSNLFPEEKPLNPVGLPSVFSASENDSVTEQKSVSLTGSLSESATEMNASRHNASKEEKTTSSMTMKTARTAVDPKFLSEFYNNSRLHHIATLGAGFKQYVSELRERHSEGFPLRENIRQQLPKQNYKGPRHVMHIDMDCFFVSVGLRNRPHLRGHPIAVTHSKGGAGPVSQPGSDRQREMDLYMKRLDDKLKQNVLSDKAIKIRGFEGNDSLSEIASCSYEARKLGVRNGMFVGQALKLCPGLKTIPYDFEGYREVAFTLYNTVAQYTLNIEAVSCDEMFVDLTDLLTDLQVGPMQFVDYLRNEVKTKTGCPCSAGVGGNRFQARMATKKAKPDGQYLLNPENVEEYMTEIPITDLPGVGYSTSYTLKQNGWATCGDLQNVPLPKLQTVLGKKLGETLYQFCRGIDNRSLVYEQVRKSVSAEVNYGIRFTEYQELEKFLKQLTAEVHSRLMDIKRKGKSITLKLMVRAKDAPVETSKFMGHGVCDHFTKSVSLPDFTCDLELITKNVLTLMKSQNIPPKELRGIGIQISRLDAQTDPKKENILKNMFSKVTEKKKVIEKEIIDLCSDENEKITQNASNKTLNSVCIISPKKNDSKQQLKKLWGRPKESAKYTSIDLCIEDNVTQNESTKATNSEKVSALPIKSPKKNDIKQQSKKLRGRPRGSVNKIRISDVGNMLQNAPSRKRNYLPDRVEDIDMDVLAQLPEDIRKEILDNRAKVAKIHDQAKNSISNGQKNKKNAESSKKATNGIPKVNIDQPSDIRKEVEKDIVEQSTAYKIDVSPCREVSLPYEGTEITKIAKTTSSTISEDNIFQLNWRQLIRAWISDSDTPEDCDIEILNHHAREMIAARRACDLYVPIKFLCRTIDETQKCAWHSAYKVIISAIQEEMKAAYGAPMFLNVKVNCDKCF